MIVEAAKKAGINVPEQPDEPFNTQTYPHFSVFCGAQLCRPITWGEQWDNAKVIASISDEDINNITIKELVDKGLQYHTVP